MITYVINNMSTIIVVLFLSIIIIKISMYLIRKKFKNNNCNNNCHSCRNCNLNTYNKTKR